MRDRSVLSGREVFFFAAVPWDFPLPGRTHQLALGLAELGARVTYLEPPSLPAAARRLRRRLGILSRRTAGAPEGEKALDGINVLAPPPTVQRLSDRFAPARQLHDWLQRAWLGQRLGESVPVAIVSTPRWVPVIEGLRLGPLFYDCLDELEVHADASRLAHFLEWEKRLISRASEVWAVSPPLVEALREKGARRVTLQRNGVDFEAFRLNASPPDVKSSRKRLGYVGALYEWVDFELLELVARRFPDHELYLVGPTRRQVDLSLLRRLGNVRLPGARPHRDVPKAIASFDVALIPFRRGEIARAADPIKIYEYFCLGVPVVTTPVCDVERLQGLAYVADEPEAYVEAIRAALSEPGSELKARRIEHARANDWAERARSAAQAILAARS